MISKPCFKSIDRLPLHLTSDLDVLLDLNAIESQKVEGILFVCVGYSLICCRGITGHDRFVSRNAEALDHAALCGIVIHRSHALNEFDDSVHGLCRDHCAAVSGRECKCSLLDFGHFAEDLLSVALCDVLQPCCSVFRRLCVVFDLFHFSFLRGDFFDNGSCSRSNCIADFCLLCCLCLAGLKFCLNALNLCFECVKVCTILFDFLANLDASRLKFLDGHIFEFHV